MTPTPSPNFAYLAHHDARLVALATQAEQHFTADPNVTLYKLRQFCEVLAKCAAAKVGLLLDPREDLHRVVEALSPRPALLGLLLLCALGCAAEAPPKVPPAAAVDLPAPPPPIESPAEKWERACSTASPEECRQLCREDISRCVPILTIAASDCPRLGRVRCSTLALIRANTFIPRTPHDVEPFFLAACLTGGINECNWAMVVARAEPGADLALAIGLATLTCANDYYHGCAVLSEVAASDSGASASRPTPAELLRTLCAQGRAYACVSIIEARFVAAIGDPPVEVVSRLDDYCSRGFGPACRRLTSERLVKGAGGQATRRRYAEAACKARFGPECFALAVILGRNGESEPERERGRTMLDQMCNGHVAPDASALGADPLACHELGALFHFGIGVAVNYGRARELYDTGCLGLDDHSCNNLGYLYAQALGVPYDGARAFALFDAACSRGLMAACDSVAEAYERGWGVTPDVSRAHSFYEQACVGGHKEACPRAARTKAAVEARPE